MNIVDMLKGIKSVMVEVAGLVSNPLQPRDVVNSDHIIEDMKEIGYLREPVIIDQDNILWQGHNRTDGASRLGWEKIPAYRIDSSKLSEADKLELLLDHGASKLNLSKAEAFKAFRAWSRLGYGEKPAFRKVRGILDLAFGPVSPEKVMIAKAVAEASHADVEAAVFEAAFSKHRGTVQNMARLANLPEEIQEEYMGYWRMGRSNLTTKDIKTLADSRVLQLKAGIANEAIEADLSEHAENLKAANVASAEGSATKVKMRTKAEIEAKLASAVSDEYRSALNWVLGN